MSEKSKSDTSSFNLAHTSRSVRNPLLSASVTGISFNDFPKGPLLLPAAPQISYRSSLISESKIRQEYQKDPETTAVTVGKTPKIDVDSLSEINLNPSVDEKPLLINKENYSNSLLEEDRFSAQTDESLLSQAATSFSQLPLVASTVFSTLSKRIYPSSESHENTPDLNSLGFCYKSIPSLQLDPEQDARLIQSVGNNLYINTSECEIDTESLFSLPYCSKSEQIVPKTGSTSRKNIYRFSAKRKEYAVVPGLLTTKQPQSPSLSLSTDPTKYHEDINKIFQPNQLIAEEVWDYRHNLTDDCEQTKVFFSSNSNRNSQGIPGLVKSIDGDITYGTKQNQYTTSAAQIHINDQTPRSSASVFASNGINHLRDSTLHDTFQISTHQPEYLIPVPDRPSHPQGLGGSLISNISSEHSFGQNTVKHNSDEIDIPSHTISDYSIVQPISPISRLPFPNTSKNTESRLEQGASKSPSKITHVSQKHRQLIRSQPRTPSQKILTNTTVSGHLNTEAVFPVEIVAELDNVYSSNEPSSGQAVKESQVPSLFKKKQNESFSKVKALVPSAIAEDNEEAKLKILETETNCKLPLVSSSLENVQTVQTNKITNCKEILKIKEQLKPLTGNNPYRKVHRSTFQTNSNGLNSVLSVPPSHHQSSFNASKIISISSNHEVNLFYCGSALLKENASVNCSEEIQTPLNSKNKSVQNKRPNHLGNRGSLSQKTSFNSVLKQENYKDSNNKFFNNPPPKDCYHSVDLNNDLIHSHSVPENTIFQKENLGDSNQSCPIKLSEEVLHELKMANIAFDDIGSESMMSYVSAPKHWFFKRNVDLKQIWVPFTHLDSALLESTFALEGIEGGQHVAVEGGRYDVNIADRTKVPIYWEGLPIEVRRCSWFYKASDSKFMPYEEDTAEFLENEFKQAVEFEQWPKKLVLPSQEQVIFHAPTIIVYFQHMHNVDSWGGSSQMTTRPRVVKRDLSGFTIENGESHKVDHLLFMVHGIGSACDLKMRSVEEVVDEFRSIAEQLVQSHYRNSVDLGLVGRIEVLPVSWHSQLHSGELGIDEKLRAITLESIPKLRNFTNDTLLDVLFYTSPTYCQKIMNTVVASLNALYERYHQRNPHFHGNVSLAGHSLGSLIIFDLLCHQKKTASEAEQSQQNINQQMISKNEVTDEKISYTMGPAGTGQPFISYAQLSFQPTNFFALGSPIGMFVTIRGIDNLGLDFRLPTCPRFYNIFHPYDPVAYRIEALVNPEMSDIRPVLIPHHKGRKRMHLELKETVSRVSADLKQRFFDTVKTTLDSVNFLGSKTKSTAQEMDETGKVLKLEHEQEQHQREKQIQQQQLCSLDSNIAIDGVTNVPELEEIEFHLGKLNSSKRIDYVLQEAPLELINEYLFALSSHVCYWDSEDTILFVVKEIYSELDISADSQIPQQSMTIERPTSRNTLQSPLLED